MTSTPAQRKALLRTSAKEKQASKVTAKDVAKLHDSCGVYTSPRLVKSVLDACGWKAEAKLENSRLLEPCAGDGAFLAEAVDRLLRSTRRFKCETTFSSLRDRILSFELSAPEAGKARARVDKVLRTHDVPSKTRTKLLKSWIRTGDFLLRDDHRASFTHVVGNPPYVRWSRVPGTLRRRYERNLPPLVCKGDLLLPFLHKSVEALTPKGQLAFVCSDRWRYMAYGAEFKRSIDGRVRVRHRRIRHKPPFARAVEAYVDLLMMDLHQVESVNTPATKRIRNRRQRQTLSELGCTVRVGPALGYEKAFVLPAGSLEVEPELLAPYVRASEVREGEVLPGGDLVITMHDMKGLLRRLEDYPRLATWLKGHRPLLEERACVKGGGAWYRSIDRVRVEDWKRPKILVPEIAKVPRVAIDWDGLIPSHGVYAIF